MLSLCIIGSHVVIGRLALQLGIVVGTCLCNAYVTWRRVPAVPDCPRCLHLIDMSRNLLDAPSIAKHSKSSYRVSQEIQVCLPSIPSRYSRLIHQQLKLGLSREWIMRAIPFGVELLRASRTSTRSARQRMRRAEMTRQRSSSNLRIRQPSLPLLSSFKPLCPGILLTLSFEEEATTSPSFLSVSVQSLQVLVSDDSTEEIAVTSAFTCLHTAKVLC